MPFKKGTSGNPAGRKRGSLGKTTQAHKEWAHELLTSEEWRESARERIVAGKAPHLETLILQQVTGKPKDVIELNAPKPIVVDLLLADNT
jgi:uncharacterized protein DUF5681